MSESLKEDQLSPQMEAFYALLKKQPHLLAQKILPGDSMSRWGEEAKRKAYTSVQREKAYRIQEGEEIKRNGLRTLEVLNLPRYKKVQSSVTEFLANPRRQAQELKTNYYYPSVMNPRTGERIFELGLNLNESIEFVKNLLDKDIILEDFILTLSEFHQNVLSGNIVIDPNSLHEVKIEMVEGKHQNLVHKGKNPQVVMETSPNGILKVKILKKGLGKELLEMLAEEIEEDEEEEDREGPYLNTSQTRLEKVLEKKQDRLIKKLLALILSARQALKIIPPDHSQEQGSIVTHRYPGYYEFIVNLAAEVIFLDYRKADRYSQKD